MEPNFWPTCLPGCSSEESQRYTRWGSLACSSPRQVPPTRGEREGQQYRLVDQSIRFRSLVIMEQEKNVVKRPRTFAEEAVRRGATYYDYENNQNLLWRYTSNQSAKEPDTFANARLVGESIRRYLRVSAASTPSAVSSRCSSRVLLL
ncbi:unnamed protein product [Sphagnum balticum]